MTISEQYAVVQCGPECTVCGFVYSHPLTHSQPFLAGLMAKSWFWWSLVIIEIVASLWLLNKVSEYIVGGL